MKNSRLAQELKHINYIQLSHAVPDPFNTAGAAKPSRIWGKTMERYRQENDKDPSQTAFMKLLNSLRNNVSSEHSKVIQKEKRAIVLGYD